MKRFPSRVSAWIERGLDGIAGWLQRPMAQVSAPVGDAQAPLSATVAIVLMGPVAAVSGALATAASGSLAGLALIGALLCAALLQQARNRLSGLEEARREGVEDRIWALSDREARYRAVLDEQADLIVRTARDGQILFVNAAFCDRLGVHHADVVGTRFKPRVMRRDQAAARGDNERIEQIQTAAGLRWVHWTDTTIPGRDGVASERQSVGRDITEQRRFEAELARARDAAEAASRAKSRFLAAMSHEIRTPMNGVLGLARLLRTTELSAEQRRYVDGIVTSGQTLTALIDEILDFSRIEAGRTVVQPEPCCLAEVVRGAAGLFEARANEKGLDLKIQVPARMPTLSDPMRLRQIVVNLLDNAIKFTDRGSVVVQLRDETDGADRRCRLLVADTGPGFGDVDPETLFEEFEQMPRPDRDRFGGAGLGLTICRRLVDAMGGRITARKARGGGACFELVLPLTEPVANARPDGIRLDRTDQVRLIGPARNEPMRNVTPPGPASPQVTSPQVTSPHVTSPDARMARQPTAKPADSSAHAAGRGRILVVEDNPVNAMVTTRFLAARGFTIDLVATGADACERIAALDDAHGLAAAVIDLRLPDTSGFAVLRALQKQMAMHPGAPRVRTVALTANAFEEDRQACIEAGFDVFLAKPFDPDALLRAVGDNDGDPPRQIASA